MREILLRGKRYCPVCGQRASVTRDSEDFWYTVGTDFCCKSKHQRGICAVGFPQRTVTLMQ